MKWILLGLAVLVGGCSDDAPGPDLTFTGAYEDWDSTDADFLGVNAATVTEVGNPANTAPTAPNGRSTLTLPDAPSQVTYTADGYLPGRYTVEPSAVVAPYEVRGIKEARIASYFQELGVGAWDDATALVEIEVPAGVTVTVAGETGHAHLDQYLVFPNVAVGDGTAELVVDGGGLTCHAPDAVHVVAGELALTWVFCD
jgi:hypothetical protein